MMAKVMVIGHELRDITSEKAHTRACVCVCVCVCAHMFFLVPKSNGWEPFPGMQYSSDNSIYYK